MFSSNSTGVVSSSSVRRPKSKDTNLKKRVVLNTESKSTSTNVKKISSSVSVVSNKSDTLNLIVCQSNASVLKEKIVKVVNDGLNLVCVSCGKDVFMISHEKGVARYALSAYSRLVLWIVNSGCSKHMTGNLKLLRNFIEKFIGRVRFGNDHFAAITRYGDYVQGNLTIYHGVDLLTGSRDSNLYTISIYDLAASSPVCLMYKATSTKSWLWHRRLSHLNFGTVNHLTKKDLVDGLSKFKYDKDHLCSAYEQGKSKKATFPPKLVPTTKFKLELIHMDLCGPIRVESINGKRYILVIVDYYSLYTWVFFLHTKDEAPYMIINFINRIQQNMRAQVLKVRSDNGTEFKNEKLRMFYEKLGIIHHNLIARTPQQNGVVE
ncbi:retrovirus-related pol polyprotein from transposon TNT 1-94 [Tanacetum coccineum]|uniref:Retrovirus-related pol polyprotein from transposon TNT 1-94 n=1 Tax=Tanacetum coccineum TaxID=301880 RepID=A0ABQ5H056_9ASTR